MITIEAEEGTDMSIKLILRLVLMTTSLVILMTACLPLSSTGSQMIPTHSSKAAETRTSLEQTIPAKATLTVTSQTTPITLIERTASPALLSPDEAPPPGTEREFNTDFSIHTIPYSEILSGGPPRDGIPAIDNPKFVSAADADTWLEDLEPVTVLQEKDQVRIYPFQILIWHEIVNDVVNGRPVVVTFCPLCNTAIIFDATVNGRRLDFGTTGRLRFSNLLMYDRQTESWWQQASGGAVIGEMTGTSLTFLPVSIISWAEARDIYPGAQVLSRETGFSRNYGRNPYPGYDNINSSPFLFKGQTPENLPATARVTTVQLNGESVAYPNDILKEARVINDVVGGVEVTVFWQQGLASALDSSNIADGQDVGASGVFERTLNGQVLTFVTNGETITDEQTGSTWNILGQSTDGELRGENLNKVVKVDHFWFSWAAFQPDTRIYQP
jgi:hypothetical protein